MSLLRKAAKKAAAVVLLYGIVVTSIVGCGGSNTKSEGTKAESTGTETKGGKILFMPNTSSGPVYDFTLAYLDMWTQELGYTYETIYGDAANDPAGNLAAVKNAMTSDVVGLIAMQDGGIIDIMTEYPDLYIAGVGSDMASVYNEDGASAAAADNDHFLGTVAAGFADGVNTGKMLAEKVIEAGHKKVAICMSPAFAYPQYAVADQTIRTEIEAYNESAQEPIEVVGEEATVLMFKPLDDTFFNEPEHKDLDVIVGLCGGQAFVYPTLANAIGNGTADPDTKLITFGLEGAEELVDDVGTGIVEQTYLPNYEEIFFAIAILDNAIQGKQYNDFEKSEVLDGVYVAITSDEIMTNIEENSPLLTADMSKTSASIEVGKEYLTRYNPDATYADLVKFMTSDAFSEKAYE